MRRTWRIIAWAILLTFGLVTTVQAELQIIVPAASGTINSIVTMDCIVKCDEIDAANFYLRFDPKELEFFGVFDDDTARVKSESGFDITTNVINPNAVNEQGMIGVVIYDREGNGNGTYFKEGVRLFSVQFKLLNDLTKGHQLQFAGDSLRKTSLLCNDMRGSWSAEQDSGQIACFPLLWPNARMTLPKGVMVIEEEGFVNCDTFEEIVLPEGLLSIEKRAFADSDSLQTVKMPASLQHIDSSAFENCGSVVLICTPGSIAQTYAAQQRMPFILNASQPSTVEIPNEE